MAVRESQYPAGFLSASHSIFHTTRDDQDRVVSKVAHLLPIRQKGRW